MGRLIVDDILTEARGCWKQAREERISTYVSDLENDWRFMASHPIYPLGSIALDSGVKEE